MTSPQPLPPPETPDYGGQLDREALKTATLSGARWVGVSRIVAEVLGLATTVVLARLISPAEYGTAVIVLILPMLASILTFEGFGAFLVQTRTCTREHVGSGVLLSILSGLLLTVLVFFLAPVVAEPIFGAGTSRLAQMCAPIFLIASFGSVPRALLQRRLDWKWLNLTEVIQLIVVSVASIALAVAGLGGEALILGAVIGAVAVSAVLMRAAPSGRPLWHAESAKAIVKFGAPAAVAGLSATLQKNVTFLVLAGRVSAQQVGLYWRAYQLGVEYQFKVSNIAYRVAKPVLTRAERMEDLREMRSRLVRINTTLIFPLLALLIVLAPVVVPWIFGPDWTGAVVPAQVLAVAGVWTILLAGIDGPLMAVGRPGALATYNFAMMVCTGATAWFTAPMGITAVAVGMVVCQFVLLLAGQFFLLRPLIGVPMRVSLGEGAPALACSAVLMLAMLPLADVLAQLDRAVAAHTADRLARPRGLRSVPAGRVTLGLGRSAHAVRAGARRAAVAAHAPKRPAEGVTPHDRLREALAGRRVLVTGASGFIGARLCERAAELGSLVHARIAAAAANAPAAERWHAVDLTHEPSVRELARRVQPDVVLHLASEVSGDRGADNVAPMLHANLVAAVNVMLACHDTGCSRVVLAGSMEEPDLGDRDAVPQSPYAAAKWAALDLFPHVPCPLPAASRASADLHGLRTRSARHAQARSLRHHVAAAR